MTGEAEDLNDPRVWWRRLVDAVIAYRLGRKHQVADHLRWIEGMLGRAAAERARERIRELSRAPAWADVELWPPNGYAPPKRTAAEVARRRR